MRDSRAIVTGAAGFIGSHVAMELCQQGYEVVGIDDMSAGKISNVELLKQFSNYQHIVADITDKATLERVFAEFEPGIVFHLAASKKNVCLANPQRDLAVNGGGTLNLLELSRDYQVSKFVHSSTGSVYGEWENLECHWQQAEDYPLNPVSYYGCSKLAGERYVDVFHRDHGLNTTILRYFHVYGERQEDAEGLGGVIAIWLRKLREGMPCEVYGTGLQMRSFTYVKDVVSANLRAATMDVAAGKVYNVASGLKIPLVAALYELSQQLGIESVNIKYHPWMQGDIKIFNVSNDLIKKELDVNFKSFPEGIRCTLGR